MGWLEDLKKSVQAKTSGAVRAITQSAPVRMAGRALGSSFVRPSIGFKPEIAGLVASEFLLPKDSPLKSLVDTGLYLGSGPLNITLGLAGSTPQSEDPFDNWQRLGYKSKDDMIRRTSAQAQLEAGDKARVPRVYIPDDYGPPRPVRYQDGNVYVGDYVVRRFDKPATPEVSSDPSTQGGTRSPASRRPVEERRPPVTREVPASPNPPTPQETRVAIENELLAQAAKAEKTSELMRQMIELGVTGGMEADNMRQWVSSNQGLAENLIRDRLGREERLSKEFS